MRRGDSATVAARAAGATRAPMTDRNARRDTSFMRAAPETSVRCRSKTVYTYAVRGQTASTRAAKASSRETHGGRSALRPRSPDREPSDVRTNFNPMDASCTSITSTSPDLQSSAEPPQGFADFICGEQPYQLMRRQSSKPCQRAYRRRDAHEVESGDIVHDVAGAILSKRRSKAFRRADVAESLV